MAMATKLVSTLVIFLVLALAINEVPGTEAHNDECLKEYGGAKGTRTLKVENAYGEIPVLHASATSAATNLL
ncbi:hypothetical protein CARUB_v10024623mg [Capsella rubella]|uniref:Cupin type-1 domain-containing protein n=1 Tax=Capsella rubella TaxID=81985 RepID=R0FZ90_9BRAS|nr:hypothetical protein CARUB_v10024623mg [Capsella rubella]